MRFYKLALAIIATIAAPALAQSNAATPAAAPQKVKKVCRQEQVTGSILGGKSVCHTKEEWAQIDAANGRATDAMRSRSTGS
jgi:hypothetical protein